MLMTHNGLDLEGEEELAADSIESAGTDSNSVLAADSIESIGTCIHAHPWCGCTQPLTRRVAGFSQRVRFDDTCVGQMVIDSNDGSACDYCVEWVAMNRSVGYYKKNGYIKDKCTSTALVDRCM